MKKLLILLILLSIIPLSIMAQSNDFIINDTNINRYVVKFIPEDKLDTYFKVDVKKIIDGDTYKICINDYIQNIRLARVDTPESTLNQKIYKDAYKSKTTIDFQLNRGKQIKKLLIDMKITNMWIMEDVFANNDRWGRGLYWVFLDDKTNIYNSLNYIILKNGFGNFVYTDFDFPTDEIKTAMELANINKQEQIPNDSQRRYDINDVNRYINVALQNQKELFLQQLKQAQNDSSK